MSKLERRKDARFRVGILLAGYSGFYGEVLRGIRRYASENRSWQLIYRAEQGPVTGSERFDGVLADLSGSRNSILNAYRGPAIQLANHIDAPKIVRVGMDEHAAGRIAAEHFLANRHRHFAYLGYEEHRYVAERLEGFRAALGEHADQLSVLMLPATEVDWTVPATVLADWVKQLPRPVAVMACHDGLALRVAQACREAGIRVPADLSLVGVDNVGPECEMSEPPLSSVAQPMESIGYVAARLLDQMMHGEPRPSMPILLPPAGLTIRESSDAAAVSDELVKDAVRYLTDHLKRGIDVATLVEAMAVSRSTLERRFRAMLGRTPLEEIHRLRLQRATELLAQTNLVLGEIARECGFRYATHLCTAFRQAFGETPTEYRNRYTRAGV